MNYPEYLSLAHGAAVTLLLSLAAIALGVPLGLALALARWRRVRLLAPVVALYVSIVRATPAITLALLVFFGLPAIGLNIGVGAAAVLTLLVNTSAFNCEIWRAALVNFEREQMEACSAFGMSPALAFRRIIFPQILRRSLPALVSELTLLVKSSPAIAVIGVVDLARAATRIGASTYEPLPPMIAATLIYMTMILTLVGIQRLAERSLQRRGDAP